LAVSATVFDGTIYHRVITDATNIFTVHGQFYFEETPCRITDPENRLAVPAMKN